MSTEMKESPLFDAIRTIEHITLRAWPALETETYDGWTLRFSQGYTGRANSVNPYGSSSLLLDEKIAYCEARYRERNLESRFRLNPAAIPPELDAELAARGYEYYNETLVQVCDLANHPERRDDAFRYSNVLDDAWLMTYARMNATPPNHIPTAREMLQKHPDGVQPCFGWLADGAVGLAVCEGDYVGLFDIVVDPDQRRHGLGYRLVSSLMAWGKQQGAKRAYLQVVSENIPALQLYERLGFQEHHRYWYRIKWHIS